MPNIDMDLSIEFQSPRETPTIWTNASYTQYFTAMDCEARGIPKDHSIPDWYQNRTKPWKSAERETIRYFLYFLASQFFCYRPRERSTVVSPWFDASFCYDAFFSRTFSFIKVARGTDWNFPFTVGSHIVLSQTLIDQMIQTRRRIRPEILMDSKRLSLLTTLMHEIVHLVQKDPTYQSKYHQIVSHYFQLQRQHIWIPDRIRQHILTNPDTIHQYHWKATQTGWKGRPWVLTISKGNLGQPHGFNGYLYYLPVLYHDPEQGFDRLATLIQLDTNVKGELAFRGGEIIRADLNGTYRNLYFGFQDQIDHPDEAFAHLVSQWLVNGIKYHGNQLDATLAERFYQRVSHLLRQ